MSLAARNRSKMLTAIAVVLSVGLLTPLFGSTSTARKRSKSDRDVNAIGHRGIDRFGTNLYSLSTEKQLGATFAAQFEKSVMLLDDSVTAAYVQRLTQTVVQNSDSQFPITIRVIDSPEVYAATLPGGYQYISRGLLTQLNDECELAAVLARGIAHTALRSAARESTEARLMKLATVPLIFMGQVGVNVASDSGIAVPLAILKFRRDDELDADYFGIQYLYKSGYDPQCFVRFVQTVWPEPKHAQPTLTAFSAFPPIDERVRAIEKEIASILLKRTGDLTNTNEFSDWHEHMLNLAPPKMAPKPLPILLQPTTPVPEPTPVR